jgi:ABC-2 type transport system permease protein
VEALAMTAVYVMWLRELRRYVRSRVQVIASLGQPLLYLLALGFGLGSTFRKAGQGSYLQFVAPGVVAMTILFSAVFSGISLLWDRQFGFLKETLVAPVPRLHIMLGKTLGGASVALLQGLLMLVITFLVGLRPVSWMQVPVALGFMVLIAVTFSALGTVIGSVLQEMQGFQIVMNFLVMPIFFLSGALFPLAGLPRALAVVTSLDPLAYGVDGLRASLTGIGHFGAALDVLALVLFGSVCLALGTRVFSRIEI